MFSEPDITPRPNKKELINVRDYIPFGNDNLFPQALSYYARSSPNHRGVINSKVIYFSGDGIFAVDDKDKETVNWLDNVNKERQNLIIQQKKLFLDECVFGNTYTEFITDQKRTFLFVNHIDASKCRKAKDGKHIIISPDWRQDKGATDPERIVRSIYPEFEPDKENKNIYRSIYHKFSYEPEFTYYGIPGYISARDSVQIDFKTNRWNLSRLKKSMRLSGILVVPVSDQDEAQKVLKYVEKNNQGEDNAGNLLTITKGRAAENEKADQTQFLPTNQKDEGDWTELHKQSFSDIVIGHSWFRSLCGAADNTGFDTQRILNEYQIALKTIISDVQKGWIDLYRQVYYEVLKKDLQITFKNSPPLNDYSYYKVWEVRESKGLKFNETDPEQNKIILP